ncbi:hypothetical protein HW532_19080 [Kaustia mangrovi]|uniref:Uncharacterized protein n=1 Tax=Kaustia mangrovi TaxID=2593653 RepID=A0A7S8C736_9HYPH|nr:hypothetical protein [Kaustia mangrovi]QPC44620.1 hypothetical protein HW532_19080 [Kaustia mangrovi]
MTSDSERDNEWYRAKLRREEQTWQCRKELYVHCDRATVDIGTVALRSAILVNAGAVVALLAFVGQLWGTGDAVLSAVFAAMRPFVWGLIAAVFASGIAYTYQFLVTWHAMYEWREVSADAKLSGPPKWLTRTAVLVAIVTVLLVTFAFVLFAYGAFSVSTVLVG